MTKQILVTGSAGFIGFHVVKSLLSMGYIVVGIDNLNDYYDPQLKINRLENLNYFVRSNDFKKKYQFVELDIADNSALQNLFEQYKFDIVINLAAQAGVRYSIENPGAYVSSNLVGFANILECCRHSHIEHLLFASSSSVYGMNKKQPFSENDNTWGERIFKASLDLWHFGSTYIAIGAILTSSLVGFPLLISIIAVVAISYHVDLELNKMYNKVALQFGD